MSEFDVKVGGSQAGLITFSDTAVTNLRIGQIHSEKGLTSTSTRSPT